MSGSDVGSNGAAEHINALDFDFGPVIAVPDSPLPRPPRSPRRPPSPRIAHTSLPVVEDDNSSTGGVKTSHSSVSDFPESIDEPPRRIQHDIPITTVQVTPVIPQNHITLTNPDTIPTSQIWIQRPFRANAAEVAPHPVPHYRHAEPTQVQDIPIAPQRSTATIDIHLAQPDPSPNRPTSRLTRITRRLSGWFTNRSSSSSLRLVSPPVPATRNRVPDRPSDNPYPTDLNHTYEYEADYDDDFT
ncbi:hypothetical protein EDB85DRAFT_1899748 [Lactarius pseudohatsudake]|nr:hypothetical protein EDB85DRAFT_1899748 [Lactarius pseudohatsudake]